MGGAGVAGLAAQLDGLAHRLGRATRHNGEGSVRVVGVMADCVGNGLDGSSTLAPGEMHRFTVGAVDHQASDTGGKQAGGVPLSGGDVERVVRGGSGRGGVEEGGHGDIHASRKGGDGL